MLRREQSQFGGTRAPRPVYEWLCIGVFLAALFPPLAGSMFGRAAPLRGINISDFPDAFKRRFEDHFGFRGTLIRWNAFFKVKLLGASSNREVVNGKNGWFFYDLNAKNYYRTWRPLAGAEHENMRTALERRRDDLAARGIAYLVVVCPDKQSVYPENFPERFRAFHVRTRLDQVVDYMNRYSSIRILDLRPPLAKARRAHPVYYQTDSHWNRLGAFVAYTEIAGAMREPFPEVRPLAMRGVKRDPRKSMRGDLTHMLGLGPARDNTAFPVPVARLRAAQITLTKFGSIDGTVTSSRGGEIPRAVVFHDSFMNSVIPFLSAHFGRGIFVSKADFNMEIVNRTRPNIVIQEIVERHL